MKTKWLVVITVGIWNLTGCGQALQAPPVDHQATPPVELDPNSDRFYEAERHLFDYDPAEPLDVVETTTERFAGGTAHHFTYSSPQGGRVPATLLIPDGQASFPGIIMMHGMPSNRQAMLGAGNLMARVGAVVILIDAPFARPNNAGRDAQMLTELDREEQVQLIVDLRRAVDLLLTRPEVDAERLAYFGVSYGGAMGGLLAGVEDRLQAYVLVVGDGGLVTHLTGSEDWPYGELFLLPESRQQAWLEAMWPVEPLHYVGQAAPAALLFQNGTQDPLVPPVDALRYQVKATEDTAKLCQELGHELVEDMPKLDGAEFAKAFLTMVCGETRAAIVEAEGLVGAKATSDAFEPTTWSLNLLGQQFSAGEFAAAVQHLKNTAMSVGAFFQDYDLLLTPTLATPPPPHGSLQPIGTDLTAMKVLGRINAGKLLQAFADMDALAADTFAFIPHLPVFNATGQPAMSVPLYWNDEGLPIGSHFVARYGAEATLFRLAAQLERVRPWFDKLPPVHA